jgi:membrane fusion protein (multidrug efflux system)
MPVGFHQTLRTLDGDRGRTRIAAGTAAVLGLAWVGWMTLARVPIFETSVGARLEVSPAPSRVAVVVGGRVMAARLAVGARVAAGEVLVELDAAAERLALQRARDVLAALDPELSSLHREIAAEAAATSAGSVAARSTLREQLARVRAADADLEHAREEFARTVRLVESGAIPRVELSRARVELANKQAARDALGHHSDVLVAAERVRDASRTARIAELERQRTEVQRAATAARAEVARCELEVEWRQIRAPLSGILGAVAALRPSAVLVAGDVVATIVPDGTLRLVAEYGPAAIGRLATGQPARLRLDGFPWTRWGVVEARVTAIANELRDGSIRVELALEPQWHIPLTHGMTGRVDIEVERASPATLVLRSLVERPADAR